jgi:catechol 2,3-dioxygenase-like lactoylglutathione lyase family enzyme
MQILRVQLLAPEAGLDALDAFYARTLGLPRLAAPPQRAYRAGTTVLGFEPAAGGPFYHFALRVPRNRFGAAHAVLDRLGELLPDPESGSTVFDFRAWDAEACYAHDPCGNIVELIAHRRLPEETPDDGPFGATDVLGVCEIGIVGPDPRAMLDALAALDIHLWDGSAEEPGGLAFAGAPQGTLILARPERGWMPTGRPADIHEVEVTVMGTTAGDVALPGTPHRVRAMRAPDAAGAS